MKLLLSTLILLMNFNLFAQTYTEVFKTITFDRETEDRLGYSVDISGNYAIVGCYGDDFGPLNPNMGSAYIFEKTGIEDWTFVQKINNSDQDDYDRFGWSVAIDGNMAIIGAYAEDEDASDANTMARAGSAYIFQRGGDGVWTEMQKIVASDRTADDEFGWSVDISDSTVIVGAHHEGHNAAGGEYEYHAGSAYVFDLGLDGIWTQSQKIVGSDRADDHNYPEGRPDPADEDLSDLFGGSVAISGDYIVVGSHNHDYGPAGVGTGFLWNQGCAYIFERSGGVWTEATKIQSTIRKACDRFGYAVDIDSNIVVVGVYAEDESEFEAASLINAGGAYIFERNLVGDWLQIQKLDASDRSTGDHFGRDVAISGNYIVIGAEQEDIDAGGEDTLSNAGAAYIFLKDGGGVWLEIQKITASDRANTDLMGESVGISGTSLIVGAWQQDYDAEGMDYIEDAGAAYIFSSIICEPEFTEQDISICAGEAYEIGENSYTISGTYIDTLLNADVCDSIVTTYLTVIEPLYFDQTISICSGTSYSIGIHIYEVSGIYTDTLDAISGCDSIVTTDLTIEPAVTHEQDVQLCFGESYEIGASIYIESGTYLDSLVTEFGCDSVVTTHLTIEDENTFEQTIVICAGESFTVGETDYFESGEYIEILVSATLCDSIVTTNLTVLPAMDVSITVDAITLTGGDPAAVSTTFQWVKCDPYSIIDGATSSTYTVEENGDYAVIITDGDCSDTSECVTISEVGIKSFNQSTLNVYPNPTEGQFTVTIDSQSAFTTMTVLNNVGQVVFEGQLTQLSTIFDFSGYSKGIYLIRIIDGDRTYLERISIN